MPDIQEVKNLVVPLPALYHLSNGVPVYDVELGTQDLVKLEIVFFSGRPFERKKLAAKTTATLLREGTKSHTSAEIAELFDFYGASLSIPTGMDLTSILVYSLTKHFEKVLPVVAEILNCPVFPEKELEAYVERSRRRLQIDLRKNDVVAYRQFTEMLYGSEHPYGYNSYAETYSDLTRGDLTAHFEATFTTGNCLIFVSGKTGQPVRVLLEKYLGAVMLPGERCQATLPPARTAPEKAKITIPDTVQSAIRVGSPLFNRLHEDYNGMYVLNTILGGYFGSRLMANIREKKGYTYNIYSAHDALLYDGYFYIGTEVGTDFVEPTLREIYKEMERLQNRVVGKDELAMVRNYLLGNLLTNLDGPFNVAEVLKTFVTEGLPLSAFEALVKAIKTVTPQELKALARKYFAKEKMWEVVV
jgi:predicted Zn-dependent peptidase